MMRRKVCTGVLKGAGIDLSLDLVVIIHIFALYFVLFKLNIRSVRLLHNYCFMLKNMLCQVQHWAAW